MKITVTVLFLLAAHSISILSQIPSSNKTDETRTEMTPCPDFSLSPPPSIVFKGRLATFRLVATEESELKSVEIVWSAENGTIKFGQGTYLVGIEPDGDGNQVRAIVTVRGPGACVFRASDVNMGDPPPVARMIDEFSGLTKEDIAEHIESMFDNLNDDSASTAFIVIYGTTDQVEEHILIIRDSFLPDTDRDRILFVNGGTRPDNELTTRIWIVPAGADASIVN